MHTDFEKYVIPPIDVICDNQSARIVEKCSKCHKQNKYTNINLHYTRELEGKEIMIHYLKTNLMPADIFTKVLPKCKHSYDTKC